ncbi:MAG: PilZ domain-containing protein [Gammaproteobacteria bacterium]|nr:MAG: PilZ domain-containing protein [Gammaproteobacteria bacterium]
MSTNHDRSSDRRNFSRIGFDANSTVYQGDHCWPCRVLDLSLKGVLIEVTEDWDGNTGAPFEIKVLLSEDEVEVIVMSTVAAYQEKTLIGMKIQYIDLDSITHLKRLVELNIGNDALLERELTALVDGHGAS